MFCAHCPDWSILEKYLKRAHPLEMRRSGPVVRPRIDDHNLANYWGNFKTVRARSEPGRLCYFAVQPAPPGGPSIHDEQRRARRRRGAMRGVAKVRDLVAHPGRELELAPVAQLALELALQHVEHVAAVAPVIGEVAGRILHPPHREI